MKTFLWWPGLSAALTASTPWPSQRVYKEPFSLEVIIGEFERCSGTQFDPQIAKIVIGMISSGKLNPDSADNIYLGSDGKTHRIKEDEGKM